MIIGQQKFKARGVLNNASVLRQNRLLGNASIILRGCNNRYPAVSDVLVEANEIEHADFGIRVDGGVIDYLLRENQLIDVGVDKRQ